MGKAPDRKKRRGGATRSPPPARAGEAARPAPLFVRGLPSLFGATLAGFAVFGSRDSAPLQHSLLAAAVAVIAWNVWMLRGGRPFAVALDLRKQHYVQALAQATVMLWWGWHLPMSLVRDHLPMLVAQLAFAYGFDMLLGWSRRGSYSLGFGPFPVVFSINLFLWFKPDWFYLQLLLIAVGFVAKDLIRWNRDGKPTHIFNPSSFPLAVAAVALILTGNTSLTYGEEIAATQNGVMNMYLVLFLVALPGQFLFGVASMTWSAVLTTYLFGLAYFRITGTYYFIDCEIPVPVFLGMLLLFTDPSTSPKTELGRIAFGALYGLSTIALYQILLSAGVPSFYDKLLPVPLLNLSVRALDRMARSRTGRSISPERLGPSLSPRRRYAAYAVLWAATFGVLMHVRGVGDRHPGQWWPFWIQRCEQGSDRACAYVALVEQDLCNKGSGWACNEAAVLGGRSSWGLNAPLDAMQREALFDRACRQHVDVACANQMRAMSDMTNFAHAVPTLADYEILLRGSRRYSLPEMSAAEIRAMACEQGWPGTCAPP